MKKTKLAIIIDCASISILIFFILFIWLHKYIKTAFLFYFSCIFISFLSFFVIFNILIKKNNLKNIKLNETKHVANCLNYLKFCDKNSYNNFFSNLLNAKNIDTFLFANSSYIYYANLKTALSPTDFFKSLETYYRLQKNIIFLCENYNEEFKNLLNSFSIKFSIFTFNDIYNLMKEKQLFPTKLEENKKFLDTIKLKTNKVFSNISRKYFKNYLFSGLSLITLSFFIPFSLYYSIFGTLLLILSIICLFKNNTDYTQNKISLIDTTK